MKKSIFLFLTLAVTACSADKPGVLADQEPVVSVKNVLLNDFSGGQQTVSGLADGTYSLEYFAKGTGTGYVEANGKMTALVNSPTVFQQGFVRGIEVTGGSCTINIKNADVAQFNNMSLVKTDKPYSLLKGGDFSELSLVEREGGKYYDEAGQEVDGFDFAGKNGMNLARLRLYNEPGKYKYTAEGPEEYELPEGIQDEADILALAKRAKAAGMQILLTFHYSDFWSNGAVQHIPHAWQEMDAETMTKALYDFTFQFMEKMKAQGTTPEYVALGNETQAGMLYPLGGPLDSSDPEYWTKVKNLAGFYNAGYDAVKASNEDTKVIIHLAGAGDKDAYNWYFGLMQDWGVKYDIIGSSYYPFWTGMFAKPVCEWAEYVTDKFNKDLIYMETAYGWQQKIHDWVTDGQISHNGPYNEMSVSGQKNFMLELSNEIKKTKNHRVLGYVYWDPIFIPAGNAGWVVGGLNIVSNSTLFDFNGNALEVWDAFKFNN